MQSDAFKSILCFPQSSDFSAQNVPAAPTVCSLWRPRSQPCGMTKGNKHWLLQSHNWAPDLPNYYSMWYCSGLQSGCGPPASLKHPALVLNIISSSLPTSPAAQSLSHSLLPFILESSTIWPVHRIPGLLGLEESFDTTWSTVPTPTSCVIGWDLKAYRVEMLLITKLGPGCRPLDFWSKWLLRGH